MAMKVFEVDFGEIGKEVSLRFDVDFVSFNKIDTKETYSFKDLFEIQSFSKIARLALLESLEDKDFYYSEIGHATKQGDVDPIKLNFEHRDELSENYFCKIEKGDIQKAEKNNILIAKVRPNLKKYIFVDEEHSNYFYTTAFINIKPKKLNKVLYYAIRRVFYDNLMAISRQGKSYPTINENDFTYLKFNKHLIDSLESDQDNIISKIEPIEKRIKEFKASIKQPQEVINKVFAREFGFDLEKFEEVKKIGNYYLDLASFGNNIDIRNSVKFHKEAGQFVIGNLKRIGQKKIKNYISEPIVLGKGISPTEYDENGDFYYISMANIKNWVFEAEDSKLVSTNYSNQNLNKTVTKGDVLIARSGEGTIGKVALVEDENVQGIFADFIMRIRLKNYNPLFAYYYFEQLIFNISLKSTKKGWVTIQISFLAKFKNFRL